MKNSNDIASDLMGRLSCATGDLASNTVDFDGNLTTGIFAAIGDDPWRAKAKEAKRDGIWDLHGWLADQLYNDQPTVKSLLGDWIYDETDGDDVMYNQVCDALIEKGHTAVQFAAEELKRKIV